MRKPRSIVFAVPFLLSLSVACTTRSNGEASVGEADEIVAGDVASADDPLTASTVALLQLDRGMPGCASVRGSLEEVPPARCLRAFCTATLVGTRQLVAAAHCEAGRVFLRGETLEEAERGNQGTTPIYAGFGVDPASQALRAVRWFRGRSEMPRILSRDEMVEADLDFDFFSDWTINPHALDRETVHRWARSRDIAALVLNQDAPTTAQPVPLATEVLPLGEAVTVAGYGFQAPLVLPPNPGPFARPRPEQPHVPLLRSASVVVSRSSNCDESSVDAESAAPMAVCDGDSGGPLYRRYAGSLALAGIVSSADCMKGSPTYGHAVFVDVRHHFEWLRASFAELGASLSVPESPVASCAPLDGDHPEDPKMR